MSPRHFFVKLTIGCMAAMLLQAPSFTLAAGKPSVLVSVAPQKYLVERICADAVGVTVLVPAGADPHSYEPTPSQMRAAAAASMYFTVGINFEKAWAPRIASLSPNLKIVDLSLGGGYLHEEDHDAGVEAPPAKNLSSSDSTVDAHAIQENEHDLDSGHGTNKGHGHVEHGHHHDGDHVWLAPDLVRQMVPVMLEELSRIQPENKTRFQKNANSLLVDIDALDAYTEKAFQDIPQERRIFMTFHPAWKNYAHQYNLTELSIEIDGKAPGLRQMTELVKLAKTQGIKVIFIEPQFPKNAALSIAASISGTVETADPLAENWLQNMHDVARKLSSAMR